MAAKKPSYKCWGSLKNRKIDVKKRADINSTINFLADVIYITRDVKY